MCLGPLSIKLEWEFQMGIGLETRKHKFAAPSQLSPCRHFLLTPVAKYETINLRQPDISNNSNSPNMLYLRRENLFFFKITQRVKYHGRKNQLSKINFHTWKVTMWSSLAYFISQMKKKLKNHEIIVKI